MAEEFYPGGEEPVMAYSQAPKVATANGADENCISWQQAYGDGFPCTTVACLKRLLRCIRLSPTGGTIVEDFSPPGKAWQRVSGQDFLRIGISFPTPWISGQVLALY